MKKISSTIIYLAITSFFNQVYAQQPVADLLPACEKSGKCGFINRAGKMVIKPRFTDTNHFSEGMAGVSVKVNGVEKWGFIDSTGTIVIQPQFELVWIFSEGFARVRVDSGEGFIDREGKLIIEPVLVNAEAFSEGLASVKINIKPHLKIPLASDDAYRSCFINKYGKTVIPCEFYSTSSFSEGFAAVCNVKRMCGFIDKTGKWIIEPKYSNAKSFSEGLAAIAVLDAHGLEKWGYIDRAGKIIIPPNFERTQPFSEGLAAVKVTWNTPYGYINKAGEVVIPYQFYLHVDDFSEGLAAVYVGGGADRPRYALIDRTGKRISKKTYTAVFPFKNGIAYATDGNFLASIGLGPYNTYYIDKSEKVIWKGKD